MDKIKFKKSKESKSGKLYLHLLFEGGDADTKHPETIEFPFRFSEYEHHLDEIEAMYNDYKILQDILEDHDYKTRDKSDEVLREYGEVIARLYDQVPGDPQNDYQFKCYLGNISLIGYDEQGNQYKSYL